ncbi:hypothetical protein AVEN_53454-1 [Araneus ventricosus]|uniref:Uncharacterized protein n=1 Tax=Araneus ventricosus TaxID=182803 RepID=A0A4Y2ABZ3_ARAVE|nr:hypothetical protein AVEN_53454-1 [Araneus ventricosus]
MIFSRENVLLLLMMILEDQQSYIRSMSLCTLKKSKVNRGLETRSCGKAPCMQEYDQVWPILQYKKGARSSVADFDYMRPQAHSSLRPFLGNLN